MSYEYKFNKNYDGYVPADLPTDLCCDGCAERCKISLQFQMKTSFDEKRDVQTFLLQPGVYAGNVFMYKPLMFIQKKEDGGDIEINYSNSRAALETALASCRRTCKHSKVR